MKTDKIIMLIKDSILPKKKSPNKYITKLKMEL